MYMTLRQKQKQSVNVNIHLGKGHSKKRKSSKQVRGRVSILPPPIHQVFTSPIHNLMPQMFNRQGEQILTPISSLEELLKNRLTSPPTPTSTPQRFYKSIETKIAGVPIWTQTDTGKKTHRGSQTIGRLDPVLQTGIAPLNIPEVEKQFKINPLHPVAKESEKEFKKAINNNNNDTQDFLTRLNARRAERAQMIPEFQVPSNNTTPLINEPQVVEGLQGNPRGKRGRDNVYNEAPVESED